MNLESRPVIFEDIARQVLAQGKREDPENYIHKINAVTIQDIQRIASKMLTTKPAVAAIGTLSELPDYADIELGLLDKAGAMPKRRKFSLFRWRDVFGYFTECPRSKIAKRNKTNTETMHFWSNVDLAKMWKCVLDWNPSDIFNCLITWISPSSNAFWLYQLSVINAVLFLCFVDFFRLVLILDTPVSFIYFPSLLICLNA